MIKYSTVFLIALTLIMTLVQCDNHNYSKKYYSTDKVIWGEYLNEIGVDEINMENTILLVINSSMCSPCERELRYWNNLHNNLNKSIKLIVVEKYSSVFRTFVSNFDLRFDTYQDSSALIFKYDLIPVAPVKLF